MRLIVNLNDAGTRDCYGENGGRGAPLRIFVTPGAMFLEGGEVTSFVALFPQERTGARYLSSSNFRVCGFPLVAILAQGHTAQSVAGNNSRIGNEILIFGLMLSIAAGIGSIVVVY
jgi:hypothetical protein